MTQEQRLINYLLRPNASITRLQSFTELGIVELSARIVKLESEGYEFHKPRITVRNRFGEKISVTCYSLHSKHIEAVA